MTENHDRPVPRRRAGQWMPGPWLAWLAASSWKGEEILDSAFGSPAGGPLELVGP